MSYKLYVIILFFVFVGCDRTELDFSNTLNEKNEIVGESITLKNLEYKNLKKNELTNIKVYSIDSSLQREYYIKDIVNCGINGPAGEIQLVAKAS